MANENVNTANAVENVNVNAVNTASVEPMSFEQQLKAVLVDGHSKVITTVITECSVEERATKAGDKTYLNAWMNLENGVPASQQLADGTRRIGTLGAIQVPFNSVLLVMRKDRFYGRYAKYVEETAEYAANLYLAGVPIQILCQFVAAGETAHNPFTRNQTAYDVEEYDRYIYHIVGIGQVEDAITLDNYRELNKQIAADAREALLAKRKAKATVANILTPHAASVFEETTL